VTVRRGARVSAGCCAVAALAAGGAGGGFVAAADGAPLGGPGGRVVPAPAKASTLPAESKMLVGHSVVGRRIVARRVGDRDAPRKALVVGNIHGDEPEGLRVTRAIRAMGGIRGVDLWLIDSVNPDGLAARARGNRHGVDLNRNFGRGWRRTGRPGSRYYAGPRAFSEPESRAVRDFVRRLHPAVTVWYHQPYGYAIAPPGGGDRSIVRDYGRLARFPLGNPPGPVPPGQAPAWQNRAQPGTTAFIVELPASALPARAIRRHARAAVRVARLGDAAARLRP
jgi:protein MpaA